MSRGHFHKILNYCIAAIWLINGLFCKVLNLVPRHQQIVARILGQDQSGPITIVIGLLETLMAIWIGSHIRPRLNTIVQILLIVTMNTIEFILAPDLLLWGKFNSVFAGLLILVVYYNEFHLNKKPAPKY
jgi:hypothetical protein